MSIRVRHPIHRIRRASWVLAMPVTLVMLAPAWHHAAQAQAPAPGASLVLGDLYREVARTNPRAEAARSLARAADARVPSAKRPPDPQLQLGFMNYDVPSLRPMDALGMTQLQLMQMLPVGGKLGLAGRVAEARAAADEQRAADVAWEVRNQAAMAFYELYAADQSLTVARETLRLLQDIAATAEAMYRVGEGRQADVLRARVEIARMTEDTIRMQAMRTGMTARLGALLNRSADTVVIASPALPGFPIAVPTLDSLQRVAGTSRPMITARIDDVRAAAASERLARREVMPDIQLGVQYGQRPGAMGTERMASLMSGASVPVFARDRQLRMRAEAGAMRAMADADLAMMRADTRARVAETHANLVRARNLAALYRTTVLPQAEAAAASALSAYRVGGVDFMTLLDDRMVVNRYRQELFVLEADQGKAWAELEMLLGRPLFDADALVRVASPNVNDTRGAS
jgi:outer membrane protein, heavy metal efflux system